MAVLGFCVVLFLAMTGHSSATYCICKDGLSDTVLQTDIDYACGAGADCSSILQNGPCFNPNTVKDHCNYAVNSYFQRKGQVPGSCDFTGTAFQSQILPNQSFGCVYPSTPGNSTTPTGTPSTPTGTPSTPPGIPSTTTPIGTPSSTTASPSVFGMSPTGSGINTNSGAPMTLQSTVSLFCTSTLTLLISFFMCFYH